MTLIQHLRLGPDQVRAHLFVRVRIELANVAHDHFVDLARVAFLGVTILAQENALESIELVVFGDVLNFVARALCHVHRLDRLVNLRGLSSKSLPDFEGQFVVAHIVVTQHCEKRML